MGWAAFHIERLRAGHIVQFRPRGHSMRGRVASGALCTVAPIEGAIEPGEVVLCRVGGREYLHLVKARQGERYLIGNTIGGTNGWIGPGAIFGRLVRVEA